MSNHNLENAQNLDLGLLRVLLVFCPNKDKGSSINSLPPLGILGIASFLESKGIHTDVLDLTIEPHAKIKPDIYDVIGFSINISNQASSIDTMRDIKAQFPDKMVVAGGPLCMSNPELVTNEGYADAVFNCEGEEAFFEFLTTGNKEGVKGVYIRSDGTYKYTGNREWITDLDKLPFPAYDKVNLKKYNNFPKRKLPISSMMTSRGCPFSCIFCSRAMGRKWRSRSPVNIVNDIEWQVKVLGIREICIYDDNFTVDYDRAEEICDLIIEKKISVKLQFANGLRADSLNDNLLAKLKRAGTWLIGLAPETGSPEVMRKIKKGFNHQKVVEARNGCRKIGIKTFGFFMIGFPFENRAEIEQTIDFAKKLDCELVEFNKVIPYAKTELFDMIIEGGFLLDNSPSHTYSYHEGAITTHKVGDLAPEEVKNLIRKAYRQYYLRPRKMVDLLRSFTIKDLFEFTSYAIKTRNI